MEESRLLRTRGAIAGVDEVGVGPLAGPVVAAAVVLDAAKAGKLRTKNKWWHPVKDSKLLSERERDDLVKIIFVNSVSVGVGSATVEEIDRLNIFHARLLAMKRAIESLKARPGFIFVDGNFMIPELSIPQRAIPDGDAKILSIACASILAKVTRDNVCKTLHAEYPEYGFDQHKGYPTKLHYDRLKQFGPCPAHRKSFAPVKLLLSQPGETISSGQRIV
ncbi:MAG: ribonuclease HII [Candidatus Doudnabacteria bacterium]|nr:ribonuclease HII [Candidatus Doudnabacteria bacterium]